MISSIVLLIMNFLGRIDTNNKGFWKWYFMALVVELILMIIVIKCFDKGKEIEDECCN